MEFLVDLSHKFDLTQILEHSGLAADIRAGLPKDLHKDLTDEHTLLADKYDMVPQGVEFKSVRSFLDRTIQRMRNLRRKPSKRHIRRLLLSIGCGCGWTASTPTPRRWSWTRWTR